MNIQLILNWKSFAAIGVAAAGIILATKVDPLDARDALVSSTSAVSDAIARMCENRLR